MQKGKLLFELDGYKLRGAWTLVRMKTKGKTTGKEWLLIKERDAWSRKGPEARVPAGVDLLGPDDRGPRLGQEPRRPRSAPSSSGCRPAQDGRAPRT